MSLQDLRQKKLSIPVYQRGVQWTNSQISALRLNLESLKCESNRSVFLNTLVLGAEPKDPFTVSIVDGQQRLTALNYLLQLGMESAWGIESLENSDIRAIKLTAEERESLCRRIFFLIQYSIRSDSEVAGETLKQEIKIFQRINGYRQTWKAEDIYVSRMLKALYDSNAEIEPFKKTIDAIKSNLLYKINHTDEVSGTPTTETISLIARRNFLAFLRLAAIDSEGKATIQLIPPGLALETSDTQKILQCLGIENSSDEELLKIAKRLMHLWDMYQETLGQVRYQRYWTYMGRNAFQESMTLGVKTETIALKLLELNEEDFINWIGEILSGGSERIDYSSSKLYLRLRECRLDYLLSAKNERKRITAKITEKYRLEKIDLPELNDKYLPSSGGDRSIDHWISRERWAEKKDLNQNNVHKWANLSLISDGLNSKLRDSTPKDKVARSVDSDKIWPGFLMLRAVTQAQTIKDTSHGYRTFVETLSDLYADLQLGPRSIK